MSQCLPESFSVRVKVKDVASRLLVRRGPTDTHPSGWQKYTTSLGKGKSLWSSGGYRRSSSGVCRQPFNHSLIKSAGIKIKDLTNFC